MKIKKSPAWAWQLEDGSVCYWAQPSKEQLKKDRNKPSPGAKPIPVYLIVRKEFKNAEKKTSTKIKSR